MFRYPSETDDDAPHNEACAVGHVRAGQVKVSADTFAPRVLQHVGVELRSIAMTVDCQRMFSKPKSASLIRPAVASSSFRGADRGNLRLVTVFLHEAAHGIAEQVVLNLLADPRGRRDGEPGTRLPVILQFPPRGAHAVQLLAMRREKVLAEQVHIRFRI